MTANVQYEGVDGVGTVVIEYYLNNAKIYTHSAGEIPPIYEYGNTPHRGTFYTSTTLTNLNININVNQQLTFYCKIFINNPAYYPIDNFTTFTNANIILTYIM